MNFKRIIIVAYRIPFKVVMKGDKAELVQNSGGLVSAILSLAQKMKQDGLINDQQKIKWVGVSDTFFEETGRAQLQHEEFDVVPIHLEKNLNDEYYGGFCNSTIWPLFHYYPSLTKFNANDFSSYQNANQIFYDVLKEHIQPGDFIWVHDYQLMLLPKLIRDGFPAAQVGFFLHIPFPSYEIFRLLPHKWQNEILNGLTGADLIGFHTNDYAQYFLRTVSRVLGYSATNYTLTLADRIVKADSFPISIDFDNFNNAFDNPEVLRLKEEYKNTMGDCKIVFSVDRLDYSKGLQHRLLGFEEFLKKYPEWRGNVTFVMVVVPSRDTILQYQEMKQEIEVTVGRINGEYANISWRPVVYLYRSLAFEDMLAWYTVCDVALITPIRDGMNLVAKEFVASRKDLRGVLILSEMAGAASELNGALLINPTDRSEIGDAINTALLMFPGEQEERITKMQKRIRTYDVYKWSEDFSQQLSSIKKAQEAMSVRIVNNNIAKQIKSQFKTAENKLFLLDYDGTLSPIREHPSQAVPSEELKAILKRLSEEPGTTIAIVSGRDRKTLKDWFGEDAFVLVSEHGATIDYPDELGVQNMVKENNSWKKTILPVIQQYVDRCPGSFIENKATSLAWHYRMSDPEFSFRRSRELLDELSSLINERVDVQVLEGNKVIEVKGKGYDKGSAANALIKKLQPDFIFAAGDDNTDEDIFRRVPQTAWSIKVGIQSSNARYNLTHQEELPDLLQYLCGKQPVTGNFDKKQTVGKKFIKMIRAFLK